MTRDDRTELPALAAVRSAALEAATRIAPYWPLDHFVAVNPMLGLSELDLPEAAQVMGGSHGARLTLPRAELGRALDEGLITDDDLAATLEEYRPLLRSEVSASTLRLHARRRESEHRPAVPRLPTVADLAGAATGTDLAHLVRERLSRWAADHFDQGAAVWPSPWRDLPPWDAWRAQARIDRSLEINGLRGLRKRVDMLPDSVEEMLAWGLQRLDLPSSAWSSYFLRLLADLPGWAGYLRQRGWTQELDGAGPEALLPLLAIRLACETLILDTLGEGEALRGWQLSRGEYTHAERLPMGQHARFDLALQLAYERGAQRRLAARIGEPQPGRAQAGAEPERPDVQAVFCIDVRSERLRRALETESRAVDTLGFAGFFGMALEHRSDDGSRSLCPVLLKPSATVSTASPTTRGAEPRRFLGALRTGAVSAFAYVEAFGLLRLASLIRETFGTRRTAAASPHDAPVLQLDLDTRVDMAEGMLRGMSLTAGFARLLVLVGHGSRSENNPFASGLDCGACGGHAGDLNARVAATLLNDPEVRDGLRTRGIDLPEDTRALAALHETTTDTVTVLDAQQVPATHRADLEALEHALAGAGRRVREERAPSLGLRPEQDVHRAITARAGDWSQVRPEWGLAGCAGFIAAPRALTRDRDLDGRTFLHSYDWRLDESGAVLETILTAPLVVASWISLQYYASTVDNVNFGAGDKTLHNVVAGLGVLEGNGGDLRTGLPLQSVDDGRGPVHQAARLAAFVAAPIEALDRVIAAHDDLRALLTGGWIRLHRLDDAGRTTDRFGADGRWTRVSMDPATASDSSAVRAA